MFFFKRNSLTMFIKFDNAETLRIINIITKNRCAFFISNGLF